MTSLSDAWRAEAISAWYDAQSHVGAADTDPEPYVAVAADAAVRVVVEALSDDADGGNLDDGLWFRRFQSLLAELDKKARREEPE